MTGQGRPDEAQERDAMAFGVCAAVGAVILGMVLCFGGCGCNFRARVDPEGALRGGQ